MEVLQQGLRQQNVTGLSSYHPRASGSGGTLEETWNVSVLLVLSGWVSNLISSCLLGFSAKMFNRYPALSVCKTNCRDCVFFIAYNPPHLWALTLLCPWVSIHSPDSMVSTPKNLSDPSTLLYIHVNVIMSLSHIDPPQWLPFNSVSISSQSFFPFP